MPGKKLSPKEQERLDNGLCVRARCQQFNPDAPDKQLCADCRAHEAEKQRKYREQRRAKGKCVMAGCGRPLAKDSATRCELHQQENREDARKAVQKRKERGLCQSCGSVPPQDGRTVCKPCSDRDSAASSRRYRDRKARGKCYFCENDPVPGRTLCSYHEEKYKEYRLDLKIEMMEAYGGAFCGKCGEDDPFALEIHHLEGGGCQHRSEVSHGQSGYAFYLHLRRNGYPPGYGVLCPTCHQKEHYRNRNGTGKPAKGRDVA